MTVLGLAWRSLRQRKLASLLTALSIALGVALTVSVVALHDGAEASYHDTARGYDAILGPTHGSTLDVVLNTMFHVGDVGGTIPWEAFEEARRDPRVLFAVPYAVGDMFRGHHVVGTSSDLFRALQDAGRTPLEKRVRGRLFEDGEHFEAVVGSRAAAAGGLLLDSTFRVTHGTGMEQHGEVWTVVGVLEPTGMPVDRAIFVPIDTFYEVAGHAQGAEERAKRRAEREAAAGHADPAGEEPAHDPGEGPGEEPGAHADGEEHEGHAHGAREELGLSAVGIRLRSPILRLQYVADVRNARGPVQAVMPQDQIRKLFEVISPIGELLRWIVALMIVVAGVGTTVSLYNTIQGRRREIAVLRAVGARPHHVFAILLSEALLLCWLGGLAGVLLGHLTVIVLAPTLLAQVGVFVGTGIGALDLWILAVLTGLGVLVGLLPAWHGLRTPVADNLHPTE